MHTNLSRRVPAGEIIKPWLILGRSTRTCRPPSRG